MLRVGENGGLYRRCILRYVVTSPLQRPSMSNTMSHTQDDSEGQSQPLAIPQGVPYPSIIGSGADPNPAGATDGRYQQGIDSNGTLPHPTSSDLPEERAIPSRQVQNQALMADNEGLADTSLQFEKQTRPHARDGSHSVNMSLSEKPTRRVSNSATSSSDADSTDEKKKGGKKKKGKKGKKAKAEKTTGPKPVSIFQLYRFHTPMEKLLNVLALVLAAAAGATQPLMTCVAQLRKRIVLTLPLQSHLW